MKMSELYLEALECHKENMENQKVLMILGSEALGHINHHVAGNEAMSDLSIGALALGKGAFSFAKWTAGKVTTTVGRGLSMAGSSLFNLFSANDALIKSMLLTVKDSESLTISESVMKVLTSSGEESQLKSGLKDLSLAVKAIDKYAHELHTHLNAQLMAVKKLSSAKTVVDVGNVIETLESLKPPSTNIFSGDSKTKVLPGGKVLELKDNPTKYLMTSNDVRSNSITIDISSEEKKTLLKELQNINAMFKKIEQSYNNYSKFIKNWQDVVQRVAKNLDGLEGIPSGVQRSIETKLGGDADALLFYSGFTPRVMNYTDKYVKTFIGILRK